MKVIIIKSEINSAFFVYFMVTNMLYILTDIKKHLKIFP